MNPLTLAIVVFVVFVLVLVTAAILVGVLALVFFAYRFYLQLNIALAEKKMLMEAFERPAVALFQEGQAKAMALDISANLWGGLPPGMKKTN